ncbi:cytochrome aa3 quinol oxidase subunit II [Peribacillus sp. Hz7]|uniref:cytochrome aa3 quinol oxidase subunit II n=1 Tax=Peribacillus sp. Hz7 TaxID=3344873 RepID=UPI0035CB1545
MKMKWTLLALIFAIATVLTGCENPLAVFDPKGPQAATLSDTIILTIWIMLAICVVVTVAFIYMLVKYRASKQSKDYEPPHIEGSAVVETIWTAIPIIIVAFLSVVTVTSLKDVEATPKGYENKEPLVIYASSSNWKWHFSYPEENIETVNYVYVPTDRPLEFKLYSYGPISSFWIPQLGGQKYAMADMVTTLHLLADEPGEMMGRNSNFSGEGSAHQLFDVQAVSPAEFEEWVEEAKAKSEPLTEEKFDQLLKTEHVGRQTFTGTHLEFSPAPEGSHNMDDMENKEDMEDMNHDMEDMDHDMDHK